MTIEESLKRRLDVRLAKHGESDFSAQQLKAQLASLKHFKRVKLAEASQKFHLGARQGPPEDRQDLPENPQENYREDMYGNRAMSPEEIAEAEAEEEKRQQEEES
jgi:hypothetical protein